MRQRFVKYMVIIGAVGILLGLLTPEVPSNRSRTSRYLSQLGENVRNTPGDVDSLNKLVGYLRGGGFYAGRAALELGRLRDRAAPAIPDLIWALSGDQETSLPFSAANALGRLGPIAEAALPQLELLCKSDNSELARIAREAVNSIKTKIEIEASSHVAAPASNNGN
jgi:hypothetical protein